MSEYQEFTGRTVEEAIRVAREALGVADLADLDFEIPTPGSRGVLGMGGDPARIITASRSALVERRAAVRPRHPSAGSAHRSTPGRQPREARPRPPRPPPRSLASRVGRGPDCRPR